MLCRLVRSTLAVLVAAALLGGCGGGGSGVAPGPFGFLVFASGLSNPTSLAWGPDGRLYVAELGGAIRRITPGNPPTINTFANGFTAPLGIAWRGSVLWVSSRGIISTLQDNNADGVSDVRNDVITGLPNGLHQNDGLAFSQVDGMGYFGNGSKSDAGSPAEEPFNATVLRFDPANPQGTLEIFATGMRNVYDVAFNLAGELFGCDNGIDAGSILRRYRIG